MATTRHRERFCEAVSHISCFPAADRSLTLHVDVQNRGVLRLVSGPCLADVASGVSRSGLADAPHLSGVFRTSSCALEPGVTDLLPSCGAAAGQP